MHRERFSVLSYFVDVVFEGMNEVRICQGVIYKYIVTSFNSPIIELSYRCTLLVPVYARCNIRYDVEQSYY
jgi:hypothetical protein